MNLDPPFDIDAVVCEVEKRLTAYDDPVEVAVLGSASMGIGEAREADFGITGANDTGIVFAKGRPLKKVQVETLVAELFVEIDRYYVTGKTGVVDDAEAADAARWLAANQGETTI
jgi:(E)-4-hydroxy-3-methylbut-2-enyl-diphosphate synthase